MENLETPKRLRLNRGNRNGAPYWTSTEPVSFLLKKKKLMLNSLFKRITAEINSDPEFATRYDLPTYSYVCGSSRWNYRHAFNWVISVMSIEPESMSTQLILRITKWFKIKIISDWPALERTIFK